MSERAPRRALLSQETTALLNEARSARLDLAKEAEMLFPKAASSFRITDTNRALGSVISGLEEAVRLLGSE